LRNALATVDDDDAGWPIRGMPASTAVPHPWLARAPWFVEASGRLLEALDPTSMLIVGLDSQRDREPTHGVHVKGPHDQDELDDMPGLRRIERRAGELARLLPAPPPFGARIVATRAGIAVQLRWHLQGHALLLSNRTTTGWSSADALVLPERVLGQGATGFPGEAVLLQTMDRILGGGRLDRMAKIHSAHRRGDQIRVVVDAGAILHMGSNEVA
jgi:hypothetical protein